MRERYLFVDEEATHSGVAEVVTVVSQVFSIYEELGLRSQPVLEPQDPTGTLKRVATQVQTVQSVIVIISIIRVDISIALRDAYKQMQNKTYNR